MKHVNGNKSLDKLALCNKPAWHMFILSNVFGYFWLLNTICVFLVDMFYICLMWTRFDLFLKCSSFGPTIEARCSFKITSWACHTVVIQAFCLTFTHRLLESLKSGYTYVKPLEMKNTHFSFCFCSSVTVLFHHSNHSFLIGRRVEP